MWTRENRCRYDRRHLRYESDLTEAEWSEVGPLIPPAKRGGNRRTVDIRQVTNGVMYILSTGCQWRVIPKDLPPRSTVHEYLVRWTHDGTLELASRALCEVPRTGGAGGQPDRGDHRCPEREKRGKRRGLDRSARLRRRQEGQGQEAACPGRHPGFRTARHRDGRRHPGTRRRRHAAGHLVRDVPVSAEALCRRRLSGAGVPEGAEACPVPGRSPDRQTIRPPKGLRRVAEAMGGRTHAGLAQQMPQTGQGLGEPQPEGPRLPTPRLNQTHGQKALQDLEMFPDRL